MRALKEAIEAAKLGEEDARAWVESLKETDGVFAVPAGVLIARGAYEMGADAATAKATRVLLWGVRVWLDGLHANDRAHRAGDWLEGSLESLGIEKPEERP